MDVFLVPVGDTVYEVYYEPNGADEPRVGVTAYLLKRVREMVTACLLYTSDAADE